MKKLIFLCLLGLFVAGCGTTFEERKHVYVAIYKEAKRIVLKYGPAAAQIYLNKKVEAGEITPEEQQQLMAIAEATLKEREMKNETIRH